METHPATIWEGDQYHEIWQGSKHVQLVLGLQNLKVEGNCVGKRWEMKVGEQNQERRIRKG